MINVPNNSAVRQDKTRQDSALFTLINYYIKL